MTTSSRRPDVCSPQRHHDSETALRAIAAAIAPFVRDLIVADLHDDRLVDVLATVPGTRRTILRACRRGAIHGAAKVGRRWVARRTSVDAWLGTLTVLPCSNDDDEFEELRRSLAR
jgi:hypothetical protein